MTGFRVDPEILTGYGMELRASEPFHGLAAAAQRIEIPRAPTASSRALERFTERLARELSSLGTATETLGHTTRPAAVAYRMVEDSISSMSTS